ncbi:MAG TPA: hypothetical protein VJO35_07590 [Terriglobales bacterium]|nr:hypothetical protein [Terriglobales bacterium]
MAMQFRTCACIIVAFVALNLAFGQEKNTSTPLSKEAAVWAHRVTGKIVSMKNGQLQVETREKRTIHVDASEAIKSKRVNEYSQGSLVTIYGAFGANGVLRAQSIQRAKNLPSSWPEDR